VGSDVRLVLDRLARAVEARDTRAVCALLVGTARATMGCGTDDEDLYPTLLRGIQTTDDLQVLRVQGDEIVVIFPNRRPGERGMDAHGAHRLKLVRLDGSWRISEFHFQSG
jgi:hypothetical protein